MTLPAANDSVNNGPSRPLESDDVGVVDQVVDHHDDDGVDAQELAPDTACPVPASNARR